MVRGLPLLIMLTCTTAMDVGAESVRIVTADEWARPRSGESLVQMPALKGTVREYLDGDPGAGRRILIRYPRGEEGELWAEELRGWLIALGVPSAAVAVSPESTRVDALELAVVHAEQ